MSYATINDVARLAGVSVATVSRSLRDLPNVAAATRARVIEAAVALDYEVDPSASRLASGRTHTIGVIAPPFGGWYASRVMAGAEQTFAGAGYDLLIAAVTELDHFDPFLKRARAFGRRIDGALLIDLFVPANVEVGLGAMDALTVTVGERLGVFSSVTIDNLNAADRATQHLIDLGHTRIGLIGGVADRSRRSPAPQLRVDGFSRALGRNGLVSEPRLIVDATWTISGGAVAMGQLLAESEPPTAVFCLSDEMAIGAWRKAREVGLEVPSDLSLIGFDDHDMAAPFEMTTMRQDVRAQGQVAAELLLKLIDGSSDEVHQTLDVELVQRTSTGPPRGTSA